MKKKDGLERKKEAMPPFFFLTIQDKKAYGLFISPAEAEGKAEALLLFVCNTVNGIESVAVIKPDLTDNREV